MTLELRHLHTFQTIVQEGSFVRAAEKLNYSQATITLQIQQLEEILGVELFLRENKRRLQLTEAGKLLLTHATRLSGQVDDLQQAMSDFRTGDSSHLRIGGIEPLVSFLFPKLLQAFLLLHPKVRLSIETRGTTAIHGMVINDEIDLGLTTPPPPRSALLFEPLFTEQLVALIPDSHPLSSQPSVPLKGLSNTRVILTNPACAYRELFERALIAQGISLDASLEIGSLSLLKRMVQNGLGIALVPVTAALDCPKGIIIKAIDQLDLQIPIGLVRKDEAAQSVKPKAMAAFVALLKQAVAVLIKDGLTAGN